MSFVNKLIIFAIVIAASEVNASKQRNTIIGKSQCPPNEHYTTCPPACYGDSCTAFVYIQQCHQGCGPQPGCVCDCGYFRNGSGTCIPKADCGSSFTNTYYEQFCSLNCPKGTVVRDDTNTCLQYCAGAPVRCSTEPALGCYCPDGYCRDFNSGKCVRGTPHTG